MQLKKSYAYGIGLFLVISIVLVLLACSSFYSQKKEHEEKVAERVRVILEAELDKARSDLSAIKQNHCYTKDIKVSKLNIVSLRVGEDQFIRGHELFKNYDKKLRIQKFTKPVTYLCALGEYNIQSLYFYPEHNFYTLKADSPERNEVDANISRKKITIRLPFKDNDIELYDHPLDNDQDNSADQD